MSLQYIDSVILYDFYLYKFVLLKKFHCSNRKGKIIILYDWSINGKIEGKLMDAGDDMKSGTVEIKNFSFENNIEDIEVSSLILCMYIQSAIHSYY